MKYIGELMANEQCAMMRGRWIVLFLVASHLPEFTLAVCSTTSCPAEFPVKLNTYCYRLEPNRINNYDDSVKFCQSIQGQIPTFKSKSEYDIFINWWSFQAQNPTKIGLGTNSFIGLKSDTAGGTREPAKWHWEGSTTDTTFTDWYQPTDLRPVAQPEKECGTCDCVRLRYDAGPQGTNGYWFDTNCYRMDCSSLCQFDISTSCPVPTLEHGTVEVPNIPVKANDVIKLSCHKCCTINGASALTCKGSNCDSYNDATPTCNCNTNKCPTGWTAAGMLCYKYMGTVKNFADAKEKCAANSGSRLPEFPSAVDYTEFVPAWTNMIQRLPIWIGLERKDKTTTNWIFPSNSKLITYKPDWYSPLSNGYYLCTAMINTGSGRLVSDFSCLASLYVVCQLDCQG